MGSRACGLEPALRSLKIRLVGISYVDERFGGQGFEFTILATQKSNLSD